MNRIVTIILTLITLVLGAFIVFTNPIDPLAIIIGMFLVSIAILNLAIQIYFPPLPREEVELKVVEEPVKKVPVKIEKPVKRASKKKKR